MALLDTFLDFAGYVRTAFAQKDSLIETLTTENAATKQQLAEALANDAADAATIVSAQQAAAIAQQQLADLQKSIDDGTVNQAVEQAIIAFQNELGLTPEQPDLPAIA